MADARWENVHATRLLQLLEPIRVALARRLGPEASESDPAVQEEAPPANSESATGTILDGSAAVTPAIDGLERAFELSRFERDVLLLAAGVEVDVEIRGWCAVANGHLDRPYATLALALAVFPNGSWSALAPTAPLRRWMLLTLDAGPLISEAPLRMPERVLHYLLGTPFPDPALESLALPCPAPELLPPSQAALAEAAGRAWQTATGPLPVLLLGDRAGDGAVEVAARACASQGMRLYRIRGGDLPAALEDRSRLCRLWEREANLLGSALLLDLRESGATAAAAAFAATLAAPLLVVGPALELDRPVLRLEVPRSTAVEQRALWEAGLGPIAAALNGHCEALTERLNLGAGAIAAACHTVRTQIEAGEPAGVAVQRACPASGGPLDALAERLEPCATWDDLVIPAAQLEVLRALAAQVRRRRQVYETWGFGSRLGRGLGISALFAGESGTGKTMAAEVLAGELGSLDLYRIDLSQVVSKYIGETEKNLRRIFDAAETTGAILLFDEADALFAKRTAVHDSHDRYGNMEVSYLLQRMESYRGLAILTTNMRSALDEAFQRRLRFVVEFPVPDAEQRQRIWARMFPTATPTDGLSLQQLARLRVTGGAIRNIALNAAFLAADCGEPVRMRHLRQAARIEYAKRNRVPSEAEIGAWT